jgi:hypothetical protein
MGYKSPNEKLNIAGIGVGIRGPAILAGGAATENIVALCDVDEVRSAHGFAEYPKAKNYKDYRKLFEAEGKNIDSKKESWIFRRARIRSKSPLTSPRCNSASRRC